MIHRTLKRSFLWLLLVLAAGADSRAQGIAASDPLVGLEEIGIEQKLNAQIPLHLTFLDEEGRRIKLSDYFGSKPVVLTLVYYECPMLCTEVLNGLLRALRVLSFEAGEDFEIVTLSIDHDETPEMAAAKKLQYVRQYQRPGGQKGWHFLTGDRESIDELTDAVGFGYQYDPTSDLYSHAAAIMLLTPGGRVSRYFMGIEYSARDLRLGLVEASQNQIGSAVDQVLLFCYRYDPAMGKYSLVIMNVLRAAAVGTVLILAGFMFVMLRRERRNAVRTPRNHRYQT